LQVADGFGQVAAVCFGDLGEESLLTGDKAANIFEEDEEV